MKAELYQRGSVLFWQAHIQLKEKSKTITNLASPALKAKVPDVPRESGKTCNEIVTNQGRVTDVVTNKGELRLDGSQSY